MIYWLRVIEEHPNHTDLISEGSWPMLGTALAAMSMMVARYEIADYTPSSITHRASVLFVHLMPRIPVNPTIIISLYMEKDL